MTFLAKKSLTKQSVCADALLWWKKQSPFCQTSVFLTIQKTFNWKFFKLPNKGMNSMNYNLKIKNIK